jgi:hypothetical protein
MSTPTPIPNVTFPIAILAGAGVSIDPPSSLPSAANLMTTALSYRPDVLNGVDPNLLVGRREPRRRRPGEFLRFELAMANIGDRFREALLSTMRHGRPNANHFVLASLLRSGNVVATTNFDTHIESAYRELFGADCDVAKADSDFADDRENDSTPRLWKLHGCLTALGQSAATFTAIFSQRSARMGWFERVLENHDLVVVGYSGSDDLDIVPTLARTISSRRLIWIDHASSATFDHRAPTEWMRESPTRMHVDCVGIERVLFSCQPRANATRPSDQVHILSGPTRVFLASLALHSGSSAFESRDLEAPADVSLRNLPDVDDYDLASGLLLMLENLRDPAAAAICDGARRLACDTGPKSRPKHAISLLIDVYNDARMRQCLAERAVDETWRSIAQGDGDVLLAALDAIGTSPGDGSRSAALRLRACIACDRKEYARAQRLFEESLEMAVADGDRTAEFNTLNVYDNRLYPSHFPVHWWRQRPFPHADRREKLAHRIGFIPRLAGSTHVKNMDYTSKALARSLAFVDEQTTIPIDHVLYSSISIRRLAIDIGDVRGEAEATMAIAEFMTAARRAHAPRFDAEWVEWQRWDLLAEELGVSAQTRERRLAYVAVQKPPKELSRDELRSSMFQMRA